MDFMNVNQNIHSSLENKLEETTNTTIYNILLVM